MQALWIAVIVLGASAVVFGIVLWRRASDKYSARTGERWGPPSAVAYFLVIGGLMVASIGAVALTLG